MKRDSDCTFTSNSKSSSNNNLVNQPFSGSVVHCIVPNNIQFNCMLVKLKFRPQSHGTFLLNGEMKWKITLPIDCLNVAIYQKYSRVTK